MRPFAATLLLSTAHASAAPPDVAVSILPVHSLVSGLMRGVGAPRLLMQAGQSPHTSQLKPSKSRALDAADLIIWVGPALERPLAKSIANLADRDHAAQIITLLAQDEITLLPRRQGGVWPEHDHAHEHESEHESEHADEHESKHDEEHDREHKHDSDHTDEHDSKRESEHADDDEHDHGHEHDSDHAEEHESDETRVASREHDHESERADEHDHEHKHDSDHINEHDADETSDTSRSHRPADHASPDDLHRIAQVDPHLWLSTDNAAAIVRIVARELSRIDPANRERYAANADDLLARIADLHRALHAQLGAARGSAYIVFHDAYQYFEHAFALRPAGALTISPERLPGAKRMRAIAQTIRARGVRCVFSEPQFPPALVATLRAGSGAATGVLDPLGA
ncbi:MAG: zinc ABC transporter substrate-binding protein, partial [bacterium]